DDRAHESPGAGDDEQHENEDVLHAFTSSAPAALRIWRTEPPRPDAQCTATPKRSLVKRGSNVGEALMRGSRPSRTMPMTVATPPKRIVNSKAMMTNGGMDATGLPPVMSPHCIADQIDRKKPEEGNEDPREAADDDHGVGRRRHVDAPRIWIEVVAERRHDDVEALEPHADEHEDGHHVEHERARARLLPEEDQGRHTVAEVHEP